MQLFILCIYFLFTLHVSGSHKPIIRGVSSCYIYIYIYVYNYLVHAVFMLLVCVCLWTGLSWWFHCTNTVKPSRQTNPQAHADEQHKHCMNQMVVYKKQLEIPLMMGLWGPETCRVEKEIDTQNKELHPLVTSLQYVQKMHGMNNLKNN